ncbi:hypothetical protein QEN19_001970 [Hanseniaspora menglaensis]
MIELATIVNPEMNGIHSLIKELKPVVQDYMDVLNNAEGAGQFNANQFPNSSSAPNNSGIGSIHKLIWSHQANTTKSKEFIEIQNIWNEVHLPILKNFYALKLTILKHHKILNDNDYKKLRENVNCIVELRKLNNKYHKFLKKATEFYYSCLVDFIDIFYQIFDKNQHLSNELLQRFKEEGIIIGNVSKNLLSGSQSLNQKHGFSDQENVGNNNANSNHFSSQHLFKKPSLFQNKYVNLNDFSDISMDLTKQKTLSSIYNICINIATLNYYSAIMETMNYKIQQFNKVLKWSTLGQFFENHDQVTDVYEDFSRHHLLKSSVYFKCDCYGYAVVCLLRNEQREQTRNGETFEMITNMLDVNGDQYQKVLAHLQKLDYMNKDKGNRLIINKEIIEEYFLYCWNEILQKNMNEKPFSEMTSDYHYRFEVLKEKICIRYKKNILPIYINILLCFSGALFLKNSGKSSKQFYKFCSDYIVFVMGNAILKEFQNYLTEINNTSNNGKNNKTFQNHYQYLAFVRVFLQFVFNDKEFFSMIIENKELMKVLVAFVNLCGEYDPDLLKKYSPQFTQQNQLLKEFYSKPKRSFLYQEDLELLHWKDLNLNDFSDNPKSGYTKKTFLNFELLDEEKSMMDIPVAKFKSKLEAIINRIIPLVNEFNSQTSIIGDRFKIINGKYCNSNSEVLDFALISKDELFNSYAVSSTHNANSIINGSASYMKGKHTQRNPRPHSFVSARDTSHSPNLYKLNSNNQRSYSSTSPTTTQSSSHHWNKRNSTSSSSSPTIDNVNVDLIESSKHPKPKMSQRAYSQPNISVVPKVEKRKSEILIKTSNSSMVQERSETEKIGQLSENGDQYVYNDVVHTPASNNKTKNSSYPSSSKSADVTSPVPQITMNVNNMNPDMFMSWDTNMPSNNNPGMSVGMDYGLNFSTQAQTNQQFNSSGYNPPYGGSASAGNNIPSTGFMGFVSNSYSNGNNVTSNINQQNQYNNVVNAMNNFGFGPSIPQNQQSLKGSGSAPPFSGLIGSSNSRNENNSYVSNTSFAQGESNIEQKNSTPYMMYNTNSTGQIQNSGPNTVAENSPKKDVSLTNTGSFTNQQNQVSAVSANSIWDNSNAQSQPNAQLNIQNVSQFNQFLSSSMTSSSSTNPSSGTYALGQPSSANGYAQAQAPVAASSYQYNGFVQQRPASNFSSMFNNQAFESDISNSRFGNVQRSGSTGWYNNI